MTTIASAPGSSVIVRTMFPEKSSTTIALLCGLETNTWLFVASTTMRPNPATGSRVVPGCGGFDGVGRGLIGVAMCAGDADGLTATCWPGAAFEGAKSWPKPH